MNKKYTYLIIIFLIVASFIVYGRILSNGFINYDDMAYILGNKNIQTGIHLGSIKWAFTATDDCYWHPLTWLSHMLDWSLFGAGAGGHHLVSLLLHIGSVIFLFLFLNKTTNSLWPSAFAAALFALHPLRVESVAWAAERKDVLSMFFGMATLYAYSFYAESAKLSRYFLCLILFALSLMSKPMMVTLPFILLLLDLWPLGRWTKTFSAPAGGHFNLAGRLAGEKIPFFLLTIASSVVTRWTLTLNKDDLFTSLGNLPFTFRAFNAIISYVSYLGKTFWPFNLAVFYPSEYPFPLWQISASGLLLIIITVVAILTIRKHPFLFVGWFWYLGTLFPVIGLVPVSSPAMGDRYTYLPSIGIAVMLVWSVCLLFNREDNHKKILFPIGIAALIFLSVLTWRQCGYWKNSVEIFSHALRVTKDNATSQNNLGLALYAEGRTRESIDHFNRAILIKPDFFDPYSNRGNALAELGHYQQAIEDYNQAIRLNPHYAEQFLYNRGIAYARLGHYQNAIDDFNEALRLIQYYANVFYNRQDPPAQKDTHQNTANDNSKVSNLQPQCAPIYTERGIVFAKLSRYKQAIEDFDKAIMLRPDYADAYKMRGAVYLNQGRTYPGCIDARKACELGMCKVWEAAKVNGTCR